MMAGTASKAVRLFEDISLSEYLSAGGQDVLLSLRSNALCKTIPTFRGMHPSQQVKLCCAHL